MADFFFWFGVSLLVVAALSAAHHLCVWPGKRARALHGDFIDRARRRGLSPAEMMDEITLRAALVRARNRASEWAIRDPSSWCEAKRVSLETEGLSVPKHLRRRWSTWTAQLIRSDVFTDQAIEAIEANERTDKTTHRISPRYGSEIETAMRVQ